MRNLSIRLIVICFFASILTANSTIAESCKNPKGCSDDQAQTVGWCMHLVSLMHEKRDSLNGKGVVIPPVISVKLDEEHGKIIKSGKQLTEESFEKMRDKEMDFIATKGKTLVQSCIDITTKVSNECAALADEAKIGKCISDHLPDTFLAMEKFSPFLKYRREKKI